MEEAKYCSPWKPEQQACAKGRINGPLNVFCHGKSHHPCAAGTLGCQSISTGKFLYYALAKRLGQLCHRQGCFFCTGIEELLAKHYCLYPVAENLQVSELSNSQFLECLNHGNEICFAVSWEFPFWQRMRFWRPLCRWCYKAVRLKNCSRYF